MPLDEVRHTVVVGIVVEVVGLVRAVGVGDRDRRTAVIRIVGIVKPVVVGIVAAWRRVGALGLRLDVVDDAVTVGVDVLGVDNAVAVRIAAALDSIRNAVVVVVGVARVAHAVAVRVGCDLDRDRCHSRGVVLGVYRCIDLLQADEGIRAVVVVGARDERVRDLVGELARATGRDHKRTEPVQLLSSDRQLAVGVWRAIERRRARHVADRADRRCRQRVDQVAERGGDGAGIVHRHRVGHGAAADRQCRRAGDFTERQVVLDRLDGRKRRLVDLPGALDLRAAADVIDRHDRCRGADGTGHDEGEHDRVVGVGAVET